jgi:hypothetical protein
LQIIRWFGEENRAAEILEVDSEVVEFNKQKRRRAPRDLIAIDKTSGAARFYDRMRRDIASDLGGHSANSRIQAELIKAFCGCATRLEYLNHQILLGDAADCDVANYSQLASTLLRLGSKLGLQRRGRDVTPDFYEDILPRLEAAQQEAQSAQEAPSQESDDDDAE